MSRTSPNVSSCSFNVTCNAAPPHDYNEFYSVRTMLYGLAFTRQLQTLMDALIRGSVEPKGFYFITPVLAEVANN